MMLLAIGGLSILWTSCVCASPAAVERRLAAVAEAQNTTSEGPPAPWEGWRVCNGKWRCEVGCYQEAARECIDLPSYSQSFEGVQEVLQQECEVKAGTWGRVCDCTCTENLDCKSGCLDVHLNKCDMNILQENCWDWRRRTAMIVWIDECECTEVVQYFTRFADNVSFVLRAGAGCVKPRVAVRVVLAALSLLSAAAFLPVAT
eukprot:CAMPEP_0178375912 /NCGR_PEP_ID=MMETSP0689_2-20121128/3134_1 /TAXON_ID=160604 /ORGANISM="Amphidinium massartii, Strain CS-259" /LENGTH=202 /DNA_ID=CAMNT_0019995923 /DNA_START=29 /DNA_END=637 /DNA_ORIENTATION=+